MPDYRFSIVTEDRSARPMLQFVVSANSPYDAFEEAKQRIIHTLRLDGIVTDEPPYLRHIGPVKAKLQRPAQEVPFTQEARHHATIEKR